MLPPSAISYLFRKFVGVHPPDIVFPHLLIGETNAQSSSNRTEVALLGKRGFSQ